MVTNETIKDIPREAIRELSELAWAESEVGEEEEKNSETAHSPSSSSPKESVSVAPKNTNESGAAQKKQ